MNLGIDLGTTNTLVAYLDGEQPRLIPNNRGKFVTPSVIGLDTENRIHLGESAHNQLLSAPDRTITTVKRSMGRRMTIPLGDDEYSPEELSALILEDVRHRAEAYLGSTVPGAVITVPAHFDDRQRSATVEAGLLAGFRTVSLLNEPTAAAIPYAHRSGKRERIVVFDFGGGTLDVTCLEREGSDFVVQASLGDGLLGGSDIDRAVYDMFRTQLGAQFNGSDPVLHHVLLHAAEQAKIDLSERTYTTVTLPFMGGRGGSPHAILELSRDDLERELAPLFERARSLTARAVVDAGFDRKGFDTLILAGGSSRIPAVRAFLQDDYGHAPATGINPEEVVATGAAMYGNMKSRGRFHVRDALSQSLSIELSDGSCVPVIRKNQSIPATRTRIFTTVADQQVEAEIHLLQGDMAYARDNRSLGKFHLRNIETAPQGRARIVVTVSVDSDGLVTVRAGDRTTGVQRQMTARPRSQAVRRQLEGSVTGYYASLQRRVSRLAKRATGDLKLEMEQIVAFLRDGITRTGGGTGGDDFVTVLETLILEVVAEQAGGAGDGENRVAS